MTPGMTTPQADFADGLLDEFIHESRHGLERTERRLLALEKTPDDLDEIDVAKRKLENKLKV